MSELMIKYDDLLRYCEKRHVGSVPLEYIKQMKTTDAESARHGRWVYDETIGGMKHYYCTSCKECDPGNECFADENQILWFAFCPKCGARMDGGADDG